MNAKIEHQDCSYLLPWYANGTLSPEELAQVEEHITTCAACKKELEFLENLGPDMTDFPESTPDVNAAFHKVMARIDAGKSVRSPEPVRRGWLAGLLNSIWNPAMPTARLVFAAQLVLIIGLGVYALKPRITGEEFKTLSGTEEITGGARLTVNFAPDMTVGKMNESLAAVEGKITSGPSANGIYVVELPVNPKQEDKIQAAIEKLRANPGIRFVEQQP